MKKTASKRIFLVGALTLGIFAKTQNAEAAKMRMGGLTVGPYVSVSSSKGIKPKKDGDAEQTTTQRITYGLAVGLKMGRFFSLGVDGGTNQVDTTKKATVMRDEFKEIDFEKDLNTSPDNPNDYRYQETQYVGKAMLNFHPITTSILSVKVGAGVRARQRIIKITDSVVTENSTEKTTPITYNAAATAGVKVRLLRAFSATAAYTFIFNKFPETEPHEQEVSIGFGFTL